MPCNCHTSSLRVFVQSLTRVQVSGPSSRSTGFASTKSFGAHSSNGALRSFTSTSAARFPRHTLRSPALGKDNENALDEQTSNTIAALSASDITASQPADVSSSDMEEAKNNHAILDLSSDSISALAANLQRTAKSFDDGGNDGESAAYIPLRHKQEFSGPSRLKRSKIMPSDKTTQRQVEAPPRKRELWQLQKEALKEKFPEGWNPRKKLSPDALDGIRALHTQYPQIYTTDALANQFQVSPEAIRRILKSKWRANSDEEEDRQQRWFNRGKSIWSQMAELGTKPPKKWRAAGITRDARFNKPKGHRMEYPYVPKWKEKQSAQKRLGDNLL